MKEIKHLLLLMTITCVCGLTGCGEDSAESVILGTWLGTTINQAQCDDVANDGGVNCPNNIEGCISCIELKLNRNGTYSLSTNFDISPDSETGNYETKGDIITLEPSSGNSYDLPISNVDETSMTIKLTRSGGCIATVTMKNTNC